MPEVGIPEIIEALYDAIGSRCVRRDENDFHPSVKRQLEIPISDN
jgi:hypothetical protein